MTRQEEYILEDLNNEKEDLEKSEKALHNLLYRTEARSAKFAILNDILVKVRGLLFCCLRAIRMQKGE